jgi:hypothetical protein
MLADTHGNLRLIASSNQRMGLLEIFEFEGAQGPCLDAFRHRPGRAGERSRQPDPLAGLRAACLRCELPDDARGPATRTHGHHRRLNLFRGLTICSPTRRRA